MPLGDQIAQFIADIHPIFVAAVAGMIGGMTRGLFTEDEDFEVPRYYRNTTPRVSLGCLRFAWIGTVAALVAWGLSEATNDRSGVMAIAIFSGFTSVYFFEKLKEREDALDERQEMLDDLAASNEVLEIIEGQSENEPHKRT